MAQKLIACKACSKEISSSAKICPHCGAKNSKPIYKKWWLWVIIAIVFISIVSAGGNDASSSNSSGGTQSPGNTVSSNEKTDAFSGDCGISAVAEMGTDIIGQPTVTVSVNNTTGQDIRAVQFYAVPLNVYGEELKGILAQNRLSTDDTIAAGASKSINWHFLDNHVESVKLYVYSVYFADGTQWGDKDATKSVILKRGLEITVEGTSER